MCNVCVCAVWHDVGSQSAAPAKVSCVTRAISVLDWIRRRAVVVAVIPSSPSSSSSWTCIELHLRIYVGAHCTHTHVGAVMGRCSAGGFILRKKTQRVPLFIAFYRTQTAKWQLDSSSEWWQWRWLKHYIFSFECNSIIGLCVCVCLCRRRLVTTLPCFDDVRTV